MSRKYLVIGHSHIGAIRSAYLSMKENQPPDYEMQFISLRDSQYQQRTHASSSLLLQKITESKASAIILCLHGNEHNILGLASDTALTREIRSERLKDRVQTQNQYWLHILRPAITQPLFLLLPPPPIESEVHIRKFPSIFKKISTQAGQQFETADFRRGLWVQQCELLKTIARSYSITVAELPSSIFNQSGFMKEDCWGKDPTHGNTLYGLRVLEHLSMTLFNQINDNLAKSSLNESRDSRTHPYISLPDYCFWKQSISNQSTEVINPVTTVPFKISSSDKVATAGSCFAQHISKRLRASGFSFLVTERSRCSNEELQQSGVYDFSARYGNIYTARQLVQLIDRAYNKFNPVDRVWPRHGGGFCDPFRPNIEPNGFATEEDVLQDQQKHLAAVRRMFRQLDVFVFTLGLTECWVSRQDGSAYPLAPGVTGGSYDHSKHEFVNFTVENVKDDLNYFLRRLKRINPSARVVLTVSPVPLAATAIDRHVLVSNTLSKSVLRVAADEISRSHDNVFYFPSYEIITGQHVGNAYYGPDRRSVTDTGVDHVMRVFMSTMTQGTSEGSAERPIELSPEAARAISEMEALAEVACDEEMLNR